MATTKKTAAPAAEPAGISTAERNRASSEFTAAVRKDAFKQAAQLLRNTAADLQQSLDMAAASAPSFVKDTPAYKLQQRHHAEKVQLLLGQAGHIEALE